ncbi:glycosyltransferase involved in cell wall biosynthesis [Pseudomonas hunanensis]|uniref:Glycosyltransferase involved in cell wall biosynthesis n=1 Tax=Pseudomonas hunanensis TaxID=1247546 RepID=A0ACC6K6X6_9PSED|nr:glycosyltransferase family 4 protein [Pseudomonas hunanensis]MDR6714140.1 glycosyltransferase involved in cell wall biosynthesis [Pseudomonas hunanensis]
MKKILILSKYTRMGASSRLRILQYLPALQASGVEVEVSEFFGEDYLNDLYRSSKRSPLKLLGYYLKRVLVLLRARKYDAVWIEKELFPMLPAVFERGLRAVGVKYLVDYDDAVFHNYDLSTSRWVRRLLGNKIDDVMRASSIVVAGNEYLAERARRAGAARVEIIPTVVDHSRYQVCRRPEGQQRVIGWIGSPSTQKYVISIHAALLEACTRYGAKLMLVGATADIVAQLPGIEVETLPWSEDSEARLIEQMDIGIMPLIDGPWEKGKCGYKLIQYMACGVPVVASPVGVNVEIVAANHCGLLASQHQEWLAALCQLLASPEERGRLGGAGRHAVETRYSLQAQAPVLEKLLKSLTGS